MSLLINNNHRSKKQSSSSSPLRSALSTQTISSISIILSLVLVALLHHTPSSNAHSLHLQQHDNHGLSSRHTPMMQQQQPNNNIDQPSGSGPAVSNNNINNNNNGELPNSIQGNGQRQPSAISLAGGYQNRCASGWMWFNNKCWVATQSRRDFSHAVELCRKLYNSSTLPTIHTEEENEFLRQKLDLKNSPIWLFARHNHQYNKTRWLDRTGVNFTHWDAGQPSDKASLVCIRTEDNWYMKKTELKDGQTECVSFWEDGKWGTQVGCQVLLPVVCEKKLTAMAKYQIQQQNGSDPTFDSITTLGAGHGAAVSTMTIGFQPVVAICVALLSMLTSSRSFL